MFEVINHQEAFKKALRYRSDSEDQLFEFIFSRINVMAEQGCFYYYFDLEELPEFDKYLRGFDECSNPIQQLVYFFNIFESLGYKVDFSSKINKCDLNELINQTKDYGQPETEEDQDAIIDIITKNILTFTLY